jgi:hypothetical protein
LKCFDNYDCVELVWANVKDKLRKQNKETTLEASSIRAKHLMDSFPKEDWEAAVKHVEK